MHAPFVELTTPPLVFFFFSPLLVFVFHENYFLCQQPAIACYTALVVGFLAVGRRKIASSSSSSCSVFFFVLFGGRDDAGVQAFACPTDSHLNGSHQVSIGASNSEISRILSRKKKK